MNTQNGGQNKTKCNIISDLTKNLIPDMTTAQLP